MCRAHVVLWDSPTHPRPQHSHELHYRLSTCQDRCRPHRLTDHHDTGDNQPHLHPVDSLVAHHTCVPDQRTVHRHTQYQEGGNSFVHHFHHCNPGIHCTSKTGRRRIHHRRSTRPSCHKDRRPRQSCRSSRISDHSEISGLYNFHRIGR